MIARMNVGRAWVLAAFFLSGITGLIYQNIWIRMLTLVIGGTTAALTTVLIAFMGGLALGSFLFGGIADKAHSPLRLYAIIELLIGAYALFLPTLYQAVPRMYQVLHELDPNHGLFFNALRLGLALLFFGLPATLMGGTLPLIVKTLHQQQLSLQLNVAEIYAVNTFGATAGAFLSGFVVMPIFGLYATLYVTAAVNMALGLTFLVHLSQLPKSKGVPPAENFAENTRENNEVAHDSRSPAGDALSPSHAGTEGSSLDPAEALQPRSWLLPVFFLMGASSLSYEVLWHRLLGLSFGNSVYSISTMLTSFLLGLALGSWWLRRHGPKKAPTLATLGWIEVGITVAAPVTAYLLTLLPHLVQYLFLLPYLAVRQLGSGMEDAGFFAMQLLLFGIATLVMLVPTSLMGASFPLAIRLYAAKDIGSSVGRVYASNTLGSIIGLFFTGFVGIHLFGTQVMNTGWSLVNATLGLGLLWASGIRVYAKPFQRAILAIVVPLILTQRWNVQALTSGVYYHIIELSDPSLQGDIEYLAEDDMGLISIHRSNQPGEPDPVRTMKVNGKFMAEDGHRLPILHLDSHIPIFMHGPGAETALVIGLGGGYTAEAALVHPLQRVDVAEISAGVIEAAHWTRPAIFNDPRLRILQEDARSLLLTGDQKYDVIISETSDPWMTGVANLYTVECFSWVRDKLTPRGIFGTWLQTRHKKVEDVKIILRTMQTAFPHVLVFEPSVGDLLVIMSREEIRLDPIFFQQRFEALKEPLDAINITSPWAIAGKLVLDAASTRRYLGEGLINTDEYPVIEFKTPRTLNIGLKGQEVWDDLLKNAPEIADVPMTTESQDVRILTHIYRAIHLERSQQALTWLTQAEAAGQLHEPYLRGRILLKLELFELALAVAESLPPSPRQAMLKAGALTRLKRYVEVKEHLLHGPGWVSKGNGWDRKLLFRREILLKSLGE